MNNITSNQSYTWNILKLFSLDNIEYTYIYILYIYIRILLYDIPRNCALASHLPPLQCQPHRSRTFCIFVKSTWIFSLHFWFGTLLIIVAPGQILIHESIRPFVTCFGWTSDLLDTVYTLCMYYLIYS